MRKLLLLAMAAFMGVAASAEVAGVRVGYCDGQIQKYGYMNISGEHDVSAAIYVTPDMLASTKMTSLVQVNVGLANGVDYRDDDGVPQLTEVTAWVRKSLDGENLASGRITADGTPAIAPGWNHVVLDEPYEFSGTEGLYIGYTFHQTRMSSAIASTGITSSDNKVFNYKVDNGEWKVPSDYGKLGIEGVCTGENLPKYDLALREVTTQGYQTGDEPLVATLTVENMATVTATSFDVKVSVDGLAQSWSAKIKDISLGYEASARYQLEVPVTGLEKDRDYVMRVSISGPNGEQDQDLTNNEATTGFCKVGELFDRDLLMEEFTTESCGNCPGAARYLAQTLESLPAERRDRIAVVCHHAGFGQDFLTTPLAKSYEEFYNWDGGSWAPAFMWNRTHMDGEFKQTTPIQGPVCTSYGTASYSKYINQELSGKALARVKVTGSREPDGSAITAHVTVERVGDCFGRVPRLTVWVVEDNIKAQFQSGYSGGGQNYVHQHVCRVANATWGVEAKDWNNNVLEYTWKVNLDSKWKPEDLSFVAFLSEYDDYDLNGRRVYNSDQAYYSDFGATGISAVATAAAARAIGLNGAIAVEGADTAEAYDLAGHRVAMDGLAPGVYVVRLTAQGRTTSQKVVVK